MAADTQRDQPLHHHWCLSYQIVHRSLSYHQKRRGASSRSIVPSPLISTSSKGGGPSLPVSIAACIASSGVPPFANTASKAAIAQRIVSAHGGELVVQSAPDWGTTVLVRLPAKIIRSVCSSSTTRTRATTTAPWSQRSGEYAVPKDARGDPTCASFFGYARAGAGAQSHRLGCGADSPATGRIGGVPVSTLNGLGGDKSYLIEKRSSHGALRDSSSAPFSVTWIRSSTWNRSRSLAFAASSMERIMSGSIT